jgi:hypothetical protein
VTLVLDYAWARPNPLGILAAGYSGVMRYLSNDPSKNLSKTEARALLAAGLSIGLVWETTAKRASEGFAAGNADAAAAEAQARALGYPISCPIFYAVDYDALPAASWGYFSGVRARAKYPIGVYGSFRVVEASPAPWKWQAAAWSSGKVSKLTHLYQRVEKTVKHPIANTDENVICKPFPMWTTTSKETEDMPLTPAEKNEIADLTVRKLLLTKLGHSNVTVAVALQTTELATHAPKGTAITVTQAQLEAALRNVLGSLDGIPAGS